MCTECRRESSTGDSSIYLWFLTLVFSPRWRCNIHTKCTYSRPICLPHSESHRTDVCDRRAAAYFPNAPLASCLALVSAVLTTPRGFVLQQSRGAACKHRPGLTRVYPTTPFRSPLRPPHRTLKQISTVIAWRGLKEVDGFGDMRSLLWLKRNVWDINPACAENKLQRRTKNRQQLNNPALETKNRVATTEREYWTCRQELHMKVNAAP